MRDFLIFMHGDTNVPETAEAWSQYFASLRERGVFNGGSALGPASRFRKDVGSTIPPNQITGYIRVRAQDLADAKTCLTGNPVYEAGGTVEIQELIED